MQAVGKILGCSRFIAIHQLKEMAKCFETKIAHTGRINDDDTWNRCVSRIQALLHFSTWII